MQSYKSYYMVSPQTVFTYPFTMQSYKSFNLSWRENSQSTLTKTWNYSSVSSKNHTIQKWLLRSITANLLLLLIITFQFQHANFN